MPPSAIAGSAAHLDLASMRRALRLAERGFAAPNPLVGCVLVKEGRIVGQGWHVAAGGPHAEAEALAVAGEAARGATAYVTLEPCCHVGRTPPCTRALIQAGVSRVVVAVQDPDPRVAGRGLEELRRAGIHVEAGLLEAPAQRLNAAFFHFHRTGQPFVTLKCAMSLDGKIGTRAGDSKWITGAAARRYVHRLRAQSGAVLTGIQTLLQDNAKLTARLPGVPRQPLRVVVDSRLRTPPDCAAVRAATAEPECSPLFIAAAADADPAREAALKLPGVEIGRLPAGRDGRVDLAALMAELGRRQVISVLVEAGSTLNAALLAAGLAHRCLFFVAPLLIGGSSAPSPVGGQGVAALEDAWRLSALRLRRLGPDVAVEGDIAAAGRGE